MRCLNRFEKGLFFAVMAAAFVGSSIFGATVYGAGNLDESVFAKAVPAPASDFDYQLLDSLEGVVLLRYIGKGQEIILPQEIEGFPVQRIEGRAFYSTNVKTVVIPDSVVSMGREAFAQCSNLVSVRLSPAMRVISGGGLFRLLQAGECPHSGLAGYHDFQGLQVFGNTLHHAAAKHGVS